MIGELRKTTLGGQQDVSTRGVDCGGRRATNSGRVAPIDGVRGLAVLAIIVHQVAFSTGRSAENDLPAALLGRLDVGIAICFVLSGFLMYQPFAMYRAPGATGPSIVRFWQRRAIRIVPALWLTVAGTFALTEHSEAISDWLRHFALIQAVDFTYINVYLSHLWSISVLVSFCIVMPPITSLSVSGARDATSSQRRHLAVVGMAFCVAVVFNVLHRSWDLGRPAQQWLPAYMDWFAFGMFLAVIAATRPEVSNLRRMRRTVRGWAAAPGSCWSVAALLWLLSTTQLGTPRGVAASSLWQWTTEHALYGLAAFFTVLPVALGRPDGRRGARQPPGPVPRRHCLRNLSLAPPGDDRNSAIVRLSAVQRSLPGSDPYHHRRRRGVRLSVVVPARTSAPALASGPWRGSPATKVVATATTHNV